MNLRPSLHSLRDPTRIAKWLLAVFAGGALAALTVPAVTEWRAGQPDVLLWSLPIVAWIVGPSAVAALLAVRVKSRTEAWLLVAAEVSAIASTVWLSVTVLSDGRPQNAQAGVGLILLPALQFATLTSYASAVIGAALILRGYRARRLGASRTS